jgi:hypothetical protein
VLEGDFTLLLVNAAHVKQVPGRKTDVADCAWLAFEHGQLRRLRSNSHLRRAILSTKR